MSGAGAAFAVALGLLVLGSPAAPPPEDQDPEAAPPDAASPEAAAPPASEAPRSRAYEDVLVPLPEAQRDEGVAKALMNSGKIAFKDERYEEAIELLAQAYRSYPYVTLLYALGSTHRRAYESSGDSEQRTLSIRRYQQYLSAAPDAESSMLAQNYLTTLLAERDLGDVNLESETRLLVSTGADDAVMIVDDGAPLPAPGVLTLPPGPHHIVVSAPGYFVLERDIEIPEGTTYPIQADLEGMPGRLSIAGPKHAKVRVDGRVIGHLPLDTAVTVEPGEHVVVVTQNGYDAFSKDVTVERDDDLRVPVKLGISKRRFASYFLFGLSGVSLGTSIVLGSLAIERQNRALELDQLRFEGQWDVAQLDVYTGLVNERNALTGGAFIGGIAGTALLVTGLVLFVRDEPRIEVSGGLAKLRVAPYFGTTGGGMAASFSF